MTVMVALTEANEAGAWAATIPRTPQMAIARRRRG
jgi:hypothetical protein